MRPLPFRPHRKLAGAGARQDVLVSARACCFPLSATGGASNAYAIRKRMEVCQQVTIRKCDGGTFRLRHAQQKHPQACRGDGCGSFAIARCHRDQRGADVNQTLGSSRYDHL